MPWTRLAATLAGRLVVPGDAAFTTSALLYNERFDAIRPAAIAICQNVSDVQRSIEFARRYAVPLATRSGGHSYGGYSTGAGLVIDVSAMSTTAVTGGVTGGVARVGAGTRLVDMYSALASQGAVVPGGSCPTVGIAGLALGGGIGVLGRKFGLTCDNLEALDVVTADSRALTADASHHSDLYWASRGGGGGNFGVVTSFDFTVHPVPEVALFTLDWPWAAASDVLGAWMQWVGRAPDELWSNCQLLSEGATGPHVKVTGVYCGDTTALSSELASLVAAVGPTSSRFVGPEAFPKAMLIEAGCEADTVAQCHLPWQDPAGVLSRSAFLAKSLYVDEPLPAAVASDVTEGVGQFNEQYPELGGAIVFDAYGGAISDIPVAATAFAHRQALAGVQIVVSFGNGSEAATPGQAGKWPGLMAAKFAAQSTGAYVNYIDPTLSDWATAYYGANLPRLRAVKHAWDPDDVFHFAQSIAPSP